MALLTCSMQCCGDFHYFRCQSAAKAAVVVALSKPETRCNSPDSLDEGVATADCVFLGTKGIPNYHICAEPVPVNSGRQKFDLQPLLRKAIKHTPLRFLLACSLADGMHESRKPAVCCQDAAPDSMPHGNSKFASLCSHEYSIVSDTINSLEVHAPASIRS